MGHELVGCRLVKLHGDGSLFWGIVVETEACSKSIRYPFLVNCLSLLLWLYFFVNFSLQSIIEKMFANNFYSRSVGLVGLLASLIVPLLSTSSVYASHQCSFNGRWEGCSLKRIMSRGRQIGTRVTWLSDGKVVSYYFYDCINEEFGGGECQSKIVEDNGTVTYGKSSHGGRGSHITSNRGNKTIIPPF